MYTTTRALALLWRAATQPDSTAILWTTEELETAQVLLKAGCVRLTSRYPIRTFSDPGSGDPLPAIVLTDFGIGLWNAVLHGFEHSIQDRARRDLGRDS